VRAEDDAEDGGDQGFGQVELFFEQVRDQAEEGDEAACGRADDVEVDYREGRHGRLRASSRQGGYPHAERMDGLGFVKL
jgi:hypothetical protein